MQMYCLSPKAPHNLNSSTIVEKSKFKAPSEIEGKLLAVSFCKTQKTRLGVVVSGCNPSTQKAEA
jgi:hypothetical protein